MLLVDFLKPLFGRLELDSKDEGASIAQKRSTISGAVEGHRCLNRAEGRGILMKID